MSCRNRALRILVVVGFLVASCDSGVSELPAVSEIRDRVTASLPEDWSLIESQDGQAPPGHGDVEAIGSGPVTFQWKDESGEWHDEELARETLEVWVMPGSYQLCLS